MHLDTLFSRVVIDENRCTKKDYFRDVVANMLDSNIGVNEFKLQSRYYIYLYLIL